jgi:serine/threonine-protein kinase RsbW
MSRAETLLPGADDEAMTAAAAPASPGRARNRQSRLLALAAPAVAEAIPSLRHEITGFALRNGAGERIAQDVALAVTEATTNAVKHAYGETGRGGVEVTISVDDGWLELAVLDHGLGFRAGSAHGLGLGLEIIAHISAELKITQSPTGSELRMRFPLP